MNQSGPLGHGPTVTVFHQNAAADAGLLPQRDGVIGDRYDRERADHEGHAEPKQAIANKDMRRLVDEAGPHEQSREKEEHRHEETVGGEHDGVEADPRFGIGMTEMGVGNDGMVD